MVYDDISKAKQPFDRRSSHDSKSAFSKAAVLDRFFSFLLDYLIISPVISFLILALFQAEVSIWKNAATKADNFSVAILLGTAFIALFSLVQSFCIYFWGATPGQHFLKLQTHADPRSGVLFLRLCLRQLGFWVSILFLGLPWLAILSHPQQQTFYDRLSETTVVSLKQRQSYFAFEVEPRYWRSLTATFMVFFVFILVGVVWQQHKRIGLAPNTFAKLKKQNQFCAELKTISLKDRLQTATALNLVGQLSDECLDKEAEYALWTMKDEEYLSLAYYAKSLTEESLNDERSYLTQACSFKNKDYFGCQVASAFLEKKLLGLYNSLDEAKMGTQNLLAAVLRYELGMTLDQSTQEHANFKKLKKFDQSKLVKKYLIGEILAKRFEKITEETQRAPASVNTAKGSRRFKKQVNQEDYDYAQQLIEDL